MRFSKRIIQVFNADPIKDFAKELVAEGMTELELQQALKREVLLPVPFKINLENAMRDVLRKS